jgi:hypothetical protein
LLPPRGQPIHSLSIHFLEVSDSARTYYYRFYLMLYRRRTTIGNHEIFISYN